MGDYESGMSEYHNKNYGAALKLLGQAAESGDGRAQFQYGRMLYEGKGGRRDVPQAVKWVEKSAERGDVKAMALIGKICIDQGAGSFDPRKAVTWLERSVEGGAAYAHGMLGRAWELSGDDEECVANALRFYREAAETGYTDAQFALGRMLLADAGNEEEALTWIFRAADAGEGAAREWIAGEGLDYLARAAERGDAEAQYQLGRCMLFHDGGNDAWKAALRWVSMAAEQGHLIANVYMGVLAANGVRPHKHHHSADYYFDRVDSLSAGA